METDTINNIGEPVVERYGSSTDTKMLVFADDVVAAGGSGTVKKAIRNCKEMGDKKKFTYGLKMTK